MKKGIYKAIDTHDGSLLGENGDHLLRRSIAHDFGSSKNTSVFLRSFGMQAFQKYFFLT